MTVAIEREQLFEALHDAVARMHEFDDEGGKLGVFGLNPEAVRDVLNVRWLMYVNELDGASVADHNLFVRGFVEGLLTGIQLGARGAFS